MSYFKLPISSNVNRFIAKNAFDAFTTPKQKKKFAEIIDKITWLNKLSKESINVAGKEIIEIQIIEIKLKEKGYPKDLLDIIDKAIPYEIIFVLTYQDAIMFSSSKKHNHPVKQDNAVLDWTFASTWIMLSENKYHLNLKISLDYIYSDFCSQISNYPNEQKEINQIIEYDKKLKSIKKQITDLESAISSEKQFKNKVELNIQLNQTKEQLKNFDNN